MDTCGTSGMNHVINTPSEPDLILLDGGRLGSQEWLRSTISGPQKYIK